MKIYTIGFTQKSAEQFFEAIKKNSIELLIDIRLNNRSQLAGFSKGNDLRYFLKEICGTEYVHCDEYAPTKELLSEYQKGMVSWKEYESLFDGIMDRRNAVKSFLSRFSSCSSVCLLCSEATPDQCHRRLLAEKIQAADTSIEIIHL